MNKADFLKELGEALTGAVPASVVSENLDYYSRYIDDEAEKTGDVDKVLQELGSPRLIAKTIIDSTPGGASQFQEAGQSTGSGSGQNTENAPGTGGYHVFQTNNRWAGLLITIVVIAVIVLVLKAVLGVVSFLMPVLLPVLMVLLIMWFIRGFRQ